MDESPSDPGRADAPSSRRQAIIASLAVLAIVLHFVLRFTVDASASWHGIFLADVPLAITLLFAGGILVAGLALNLVRGEFGSDLLAGISIVTSVLLGEFLAGTFVVLMLSGGQVLEAFAVRNASSVLSALARRMPSIAHRRRDGSVRDITLSEVHVGDHLEIFPHEICPVDGTVLSGHGVMDESYLTGEPYLMSKTPGSKVLSGAINGEAVLTIQAEKLPMDSRYAKIMEVMRASEQRRPRLRRLGDQLGAIYTPVALSIALLAWLVSSEPIRFLAVLVVATPCPLLIAIPVAIIGSVSLAARRAIIIKDPSILERVCTCRTAIFDKTGTLTYGEPRLTEIIPAPAMREPDLLMYTASLERYSKHPLARAVLDAANARQLPLREASEVNEPQGEGLRGTVHGRTIWITNRVKFLRNHAETQDLLPAPRGGLECVVVMDHQFAGVLTFRDEPRTEGKPFVAHLGARHGFSRVLLVSGDREAEVRYLAQAVGIREVHANQTPEQKLDLVRRETESAPTVFVGDGINDAPALTAATVGIAFGHNSDITTEAAGAVVLEASLRRVDELFHLSQRMRTIALQSAVGGMLLSVMGMLLASFGLLPPVAGAITQEVIDLAAVLNALRAAIPPERLTDY